MPFDTRHSHHAENLARGGCAIPQDASQRRPFPNLLHQLDGPLAVAKFGKSGFHRDSYGAAHLDGIHAEVVGHPGQLPDGIQVIDPTVGTKRKRSLVLDHRDQLGSIRFGNDVGALDNTAGMAWVSHPAAASLLHILSHHLAGNIGCPLKSPGAEVAGG